MYETSIQDGNESQLDAVAFERSVQRATLDLQRIVVQLAKHHAALRDKSRESCIPFTLRALLDIDEQAFADLGFQGRHPVDVRGGFARLAGSRVVDADHDLSVDWQRDEDPTPAVYAIVRALVHATSIEIA